MADINPGLGDSSPADHTVFGDHLYFSANGGTSGRALWRTDGTTTAVVADINPGAGQHLGVDDRFRAVQQQLRLLLDHLLQRGVASQGFTESIPMRMRNR